MMMKPGRSHWLLVLASTTDGALNQSVLPVVTCFVSACYT